MIDPIPRQDLKMPPPVGFVTTTAYFAMEQTLEARIAELQAAIAEVTALKAELVEALRLALKLADEMQVFCRLHGLGPSGEWAGVSDTLAKFTGVKDANG